MNERAGRNWFRLWLLVGIVGAGGVCDAGASTIYTYTDEKGNFVATDSLANVPPKYRALVKVREVQDSPRTSAQETKSEAVFSPQASLESFVSWLVDQFPKSLTIPGLTPGQSMGVIGGVLVGALTLVAMLFSDNLFANVFAKLFLKFVLPLVVVGAISALYLSYLSQIGDSAAPGSGQRGSPGNVFQKAQESVKAQEAAQQQQKRALDSILEPIEQQSPPAAGRR